VQKQCNDFRFVASFQNSSTKKYAMRENRLFLLLLLQSVLGAILFLLLSLPLVSILYHLLFIAIFHYFLSVTWNSIHSFYLRVAFLYSYQLGVTLFYFIICVGLVYWGDILTVNILKPYVLNLTDFCASVAISPYSVYLFILVFLLVNFLWVLLVCKQILPPPNTKRSRFAVLLFFILLLFCLPIKRFFHFRSEPFLVFAFDKMWGAADNPFFNPYRTKVAVNDQRVAAHYPKQLNNNRNVILIVCDALRADHLPMYGYSRNTTPFLSRLYASGEIQKIENCITTSASTICGIPSLMQSKEWKNCTHDGFTLFKLFKKQGYQTSAIIAGAHKTWYNIAGTYAHDCDYYFDGMDAHKHYFKDDRVVLEGIENGQFKEDNNFFYLHLQSPHETALLQNEFAIWKPYAKTAGSTNDRLLRLTNLYDNKILQADFTIQKIFEELDHKGILKNAMVIITADHGEGLGEHGVDGHVDWLYQAQTRVPLLIIDNQNKYPSEKFSRQIDIAPTIAQALHFALPSCWQGVSLLDSTTVQYSFHETGKAGLETKRQLYAIINNEDSVIYKYIFSKDFKQEELYELKHDSTENNNLVNQETQRIKRFRLFVLQNFALHFDLGD
jgi:glucan phosphoethanolaminetransferase (alkaline phosphatase superfamily)